MKLARLASAFALALLLLAPLQEALGQSGGQFFTPNGNTAEGTVPLCSNGASPPKYVPCSGGAGGGGFGNVGGFNISVPKTPTVQNAAYSSGNAIGGLQTVAFFRTTTQPSGILNNVSLASKGGSTTPVTTYVFNANPTASTCTDKSAFVLGAADISKLITTLPVVLTPAIVGVGATATFASQQLPVSVKNFDGAATVNLYVCLVVGGTVTPATTTDLVLGLAGVQD